MGELMVLMHEPHELGCVVWLVGVLRRSCWSGPLSRNLQVMSPRHQTLHLKAATGPARRCPLVPTRQQGLARTSGSLRQSGLDWATIMNALNLNSETARVLKRMLGSRYSVHKHAGHETLCL